MKQIVKDFSNDIVRFDSMEHDFRNGRYLAICDGQRYMLTVSVGKHSSTFYWLNVKSGILSDFVNFGSCLDALKFMIELPIAKLYIADSWSEIKEFIR